MRIGGSILALAVIAGCAEASSGTDAGARDGGHESDARPAEDAAIAGDAGPPIDAGPAPDAPPMPEVCEGGIDEDADTLIDCDDPECWEEDACAAEHVAETMPGLVACV